MRKNFCVALLVFFSAFVYAQHSITKINYSSYSITPYYPEILNDTITVAIGSIIDGNAGQYKHKGFTILKLNESGNIVSHSALYFAENHGRFPSIKSYVISQDSGIIFTGSSLESSYENILLANINFEDSIKGAYTYKIENYYSTGDFVHQNGDGSIMVIGNAIFDRNAFIRKLFWMKLDRLGNVLWSRWAVTNRDCTVALASNSIYMNDGTYLTVSLCNSELIFVRCFADGKLELFNNQTINNNSNFFRLIESSLGEIYFLVSSTNPYIDQGYELTIGKIDSLGSISWARVIGDTQNNLPQDFIFDGNDFYIVAYNQNMSLAPRFQGVLLKLNLDGNIQWVKKLINPKGVNDASVISSIIHYNDSGLVLGGFYGDEFDQDYGFLLPVDLNGNSECDWKSHSYSQIDLTTNNLNLSIDTLSFPVQKSSATLIQSPMIMEEDFDCVLPPEPKIVLPPDILISPNPTSGLLNIKIIGEQKGSSLKIFDLVGHLIFESTSTFDNIDLSRFSTGIYILEFQSDVFQFKTKILKCD